MVGELLRISQSAIGLPQIHHFPQGRMFRNRSELGFSPPSVCAQGQLLQHKWLLKWTSTDTRVVSDSKAAIEIQPDTSGGGDGFRGRTDGEGGGGGGGGGWGGGDGDNNSDETEGGSDESDHIKKMGMSMSQKLTLAYAVLVGGNVPELP